MKLFMKKLWNQKRSSKGDIRGKRFVTKSPNIGEAITVNELGC